MGDLRHCRVTEKSSLYTSRLHSATHWIRNLVGHTVCLDVLRPNIIFSNHELSSDSPVVDLGCTNPNSRVAVLLDYVWRRLIILNPQFETSFISPILQYFEVVLRFFGKYFYLHFNPFIFLITLSMLKKLTVK